MTSFSKVCAKLRRHGKSQYMLLSLCCFISTLLITAYALMMRSPTVLTVLPEGGDSRKQVMMIFALTVVGCGVFIAYASGLFFRYKSRECGVFLALGVSKERLAATLLREVAAMAVLSCAGGIALGGPLAWCVWQLFRLWVVDTQEMALYLDLKAYGVPAAFSAYVLLLLFFMLRRFIRRTNILDIISESRRSEAIRAVPRFYGAVGIISIIGGCILGYQMPAVFIFGLHWYPPEWLTAIFYLPVFTGLYMILLHTVVNGWRQGRSRYTHLVTTSLMRFQGRQTVRNLVVVTVLIAGAYFASFYVPILGTGAYQSFDERKADFAFHCRADQSLPTEEEILDLAAEKDVKIKSYAEGGGAVLAYDGEAHVEQEGPMGVTYTKEYRRELSSCTFLPESVWNALTGDTLDLAPGTAVGVFDDAGDGGGRMGNEISLVTNFITGESLSVTPVEPVLCSTALFGRRVLDDGDYAALSAGLPDELLEREVIFNAENAEESYGFAKALFNKIVDRSGPEVEIYDSWDPLEKRQAEAAGEPYYYDNEYLDEHGYERVDYALRDSSNFRLFWKYMPQFRALDKAEFLRTMAVYVMLFVFIAIVCFSAVLVILFTRCMTIALVNKQVYGDLRRLGASEKYLCATVRRQISRAFLVPSITGSGMICLFYGMILFFNDNKFSSGELSGMAACGLLVLAVSVLLWGFYRLTLSRAWAAVLK